MGAGQSSAVNQALVYRAWKKLAAMRARSGTRRMLRFLAGRLFVRVWRSVVFDMVSPDQPVSVDWPTQQLLSIFTADGPRLTPELDTFIRRYESELPDRVAAGDWLYVIMVEGRCAHFGSVCFFSRQLRVLADKMDSPVIGHCFTAPDARGQGLYRHALATVASRLQAAGYSRIVIETSPDNYASRRGIEAAGFRLRRLIKTVILFNYFAVAAIEENGHTRVRAWLI
jgi:RimJ/RimL family protein N-acetyltransferase